MTPAGEAALQVPQAVAYYAALLGMMRLAGKRLAGQTTTFDLLVLISLAVVLQETGQITVVVAAHEAAKDAAEATSAKFKER
jgi:hypothetical protein